TPASVHPLAPAFGRHPKTLNVSCRSAASAKSVGFGPLTGHSPASLDDLVGAGEDRWRDGEAERLGRLQVDDKLDLGGLQDRQVTRLLARENSACILSCYAVLFGDRRAVADQA